MTEVEIWAAWTIYFARRRRYSARTGRNRRFRAARTFQPPPAGKNSRPFMHAIPRFVALLLLAVTLAQPGAHAAERRPNFLLILGDNVGQDWFGCYGSDEKCTPNVDKLAATGVRFEHCYVTALCSTTRA